MAKRKKKPLMPAKFKVGDKVRVKHGVEDVDSTLTCHSAAGREP